MNAKTIAIALLSVALLGPPVDASAQTARTMYTQALARERALRDAAKEPTLQQLRAAISAYERIVRKYPASGYSDNALWQAGNLALLAFDRFGQPSDRRTGLRLLNDMQQQFPTSSLVPRAAAIVKEREAAPATPPPPAAPVRAAASAPASPVPTSGSAIGIREIRRTEIPEGVRITLELEAEVLFQANRIENPQRLFFDLRGVSATPAQEAGLRFDDDLVSEVRFGRHPGATRVVMEMPNAESFSVFTLYDPFRIMVDVKRAAAGAPKPLPPPETDATASKRAATPPAPPSTATPPKTTTVQHTDGATSAAAVPTPPVTTGPPPVPPSANSDGTYSLARQLGLGVSRIVIDAGHGGHDPGAKANGLTEAELTLDVALRLQKLLEKQPGMEVVMTRATDVFIPLEERTRVANREGADLFLSIHANASRNVRAHGVETYFLNFATNPEAEAVAARENAGSGQTMHKLPEIVRAITLNNKINESRDFAEMVQGAMVRRLSARNKNLRNIGVKQAPFVVLIGAEMPSVLAEMSFVTNRQDAALLKTGAYRQAIAEALLDAILRYQQSLKKMRTAATAQTSAR